ncbi:hypothetical protein LEMLEM_LOCUS21050, partial [Lemmus lemmus]
MTGLHHPVWHVPYHGQNLRPLSCKASSLPPMEPHTDPPDTCLPLPPHSWNDRTRVTLLDGQPCGVTFNVC